ncbi:hypothetical protein ACVRYP_06545 [Streptococcus rifensis]
MADKQTTYYDDYPVKPYISPERDLAEETLGFKPVPRRNMEPLEDGLLAGDIILLWRIAFGTFTTDSVMPKYLEYTYGIDGQTHLKKLETEGYILKETAVDSLDHITATVKKTILKDSGVSGLSKYRSAELDDLIKTHLTEVALASYFDIRGYGLTGKGQKALANHQAVVDRHPKKKF